MSWITSSVLNLSRSSSTLEDVYSKNFVWFFPRMITARSTWQRTASSCAFLNRPAFRFTKVTFLFLSSVMGWMEIFLLPIVCVLLVGCFSVAGAVQSVGYNCGVSCDLLAGERRIVTCACVCVVLAVPYVQPCSTLCTISQGPNNVPALGRTAQK